MGKITHSKIACPRPECHKVIQTLPTFHGYRSPHPLKNLLKGYQTSVTTIHQVLSGFSLRPCLSRLYKMVNADIPMPPLLGCSIWRYIYSLRGRWWTIIAEFSIRGEHYFLTSDGIYLKKVSREEIFGIHPRRKTPKC